MRRRGWRSGRFVGYAAVDGTHAFSPLRFPKLRTALLVGAGAFVLVACGGGGGGGNAGSAPPAPVIVSPAAGSTFKGGDTLVVQGRATNAQGGALGAGSLTWWVDLHHDTHTHPLVLPTPGTGGSVEIPTRGETSDNIWLRVHLQAVDSEGLATEVTRDVMPQKVRFTVASQPPGLRLTLDGQPFTAPRTITGVVGVERDLGAANQVFNGRRWQFSNWSDGGAAAHTITTPPADRTFTAVFIDAGPDVNTPPSVALTAPANNSSGVAGMPIVLSATASDSDGTIANVQFFDGSTAIGAPDTTAPYSVSWTPSTLGVHTLTARATDDRGAIATSAAVSVTIELTGSDTQPPIVNIVEPAALADGLAGTIVFRADAIDNVGVASVEFQIDGMPVATVTAAPYSTTVDTSVHAAGQHVLRVRGRDSAGNVSPWTSVLVRFGGTREAPAGITRTPGWVTGLSFPTAFSELPDGRLLVTQQRGEVRVVMPDATLLAAPMLTVLTDYTLDRGLLGVVAHPRFATNGLIYVYYTVPAPLGGEARNRLSRFTVSGNTATGEVVLAEFPPLPSGFHNGGGMLFGLDGKLYLGVGDAGFSANAPDLATPLGKLLRFNEDGSIPNDNPFCTTPGNLACAIWAYGLRNPFTLAMQPVTGRMHINDVGSMTWEEINVVARGANFGWPASEGPMGVTAGMTGPLFTYNHAAATPPGSGPGGFFVGNAVIGGGFYPENGPFPAPWRGGYFFTDYVTAFVGFIDLKNDNEVYSFGSVPPQPAGMLVRSDGSLLVLHRGVTASITRFTAP